jgi:urease accessory protein
MKIFLYGSKGDRKKGEVMKEPVIIGVGGPVGSGKTLLIERVTRMMANDYKIAVITNDIYTKEDAMFMVKNSVLPEDRIIGVETGGCPHTAIREDASMNFAAIDELKSRFDDLDIIFLESGGDNLAATFSPDLVDFSIYIIDVAQGEKIPRKAGQGMIKSDMFIINKIDLAPYVGANLDVMREDTKVFRKEKDFIFTNLKTDEGVNKVIDWIKSNCLLEGLK